MKLWKRRETLIYKGITCRISAVEKPWGWALVLVDNNERSSTTMIMSANEVVAVVRRKYYVEAAVPAPGAGHGDMPPFPLSPQPDDDDHRVSSWMVSVNGTRFNWLKDFKGMEDGNGTEMYQRVSEAVRTYWITGKFERPQEDRGIGHV